MASRRHDFAAEPLVVSLEGEPTPEMRDEARAAFTAADGRAPLWLASTLEPGGSFWLGESPPAHALLRARALASSSLHLLRRSVFSGHVSDEGSEDGSEMMAVFDPPLHEFDVLIEVHRAKRDRDGGGPVDQLVKALRERCAASPPPPSGRASRPCCRCLVRVICSQPPRPHAAKGQRRALRSDSATSHSSFTTPTTAR